jgi:hypothetical protein
MAIRASPIVYNKTQLEIEFVFHCNQQIQTRLFLKSKIVLENKISKGIKYCVNALRWVKVALFFSVVVFIFCQFAFSAHLMIEPLELLII